jgi:hypothetical protein
MYYPSLVYCVDCSKFVISTLWKDLFPGLVRDMKFPGRENISIFTHHRCVPYCSPQVLRVRVLQVPNKNQTENSDCKLVAAHKLRKQTSSQRWPEKSVGGDLSVPEWSPTCSGSSALNQISPDERNKIVFKYQSLLKLLLDTETKGGDHRRRI